MCRNQEVYVSKAKAEKDNRDHFGAGMMVMVIIAGALHHYGFWCLT
jgi:hypothetical protein